MSMAFADGTCLTCADYVATAVVVRLDAGGLALVTVGEKSEEISVALVDAKVGDTVLVHAAEAIAVMPADGAQTS